MVKHLFIDESGTREMQEIMTVAAVVFDGANSADTLHTSVMKTLNPDYLKLVSALRKQRKELPQMHYIDLSDKQKRDAGERLGRANIAVYSASYWYDEVPMVEHSIRFPIYSQLVTQVIEAAFKDHKELKIGIAKQGGWQKYGPAFLGELKKIPDKYHQENGEYREGDFFLVSAAKSGIQLADFYVGSIRDSHRNLNTAHDRIKHQVKTYTVYQIPALDKKER